MRLKEGDKERDILNASTGVFASMGYGQAKISNIAAQANIATGSVYLYFQNKEEILLRLLFDLWNDIYERSIEIVGQNLEPGETLDLILVSAMDILFKDPNLARIYGNEQNLWMVRRKGKFRLKYEHFLNLLNDLYRRGKNSGVFNENLNSHLAVEFVIGGIRNLVHKWSLDPDAKKLQQLKNEILMIVRHAVSA